ncbi:IclR family transcriptional regulator [Paenibacillus koleovorans]|uniref:IclR family transcriptional regulator n=1 Tax=Paenibacillus koleovorans TaxID=121608 RepID=UPI000FD9F6A7|nr:IclR family transcriptional regulator [Paenibacillus koleovorans]
MKKNRYSVPALEKAIVIIESLSQSKHPLGITDLYALCGLPKSSIFMILNTLEDLQYVAKLEGDKYSLTLKVYNLGMAVLSKLNVRELARPYMEALAEELRFTVHLAKLEHDKAMYIEKVSGPGFVQFSTVVGQSWPLYISAGGKVLAAYMSEEQLSAVLESCTFESFTPNTITSEEAFRELLQSVREQQYAFEDEEGELGIRCVAAPVFDDTGKAVAALSVTALRNELPIHKVLDVSAALRRKALLISQQLGYPL